MQESNPDILGQKKRGEGAQTLPAMKESDIGDGAQPNDPQAKTDPGPAPKENPKTVARSKIATGTMVLLIIIPLAYFLGFALAANYMPHDFLVRHKDQIQLWAAIVSIGGGTAAMTGSFIAAMIEMENSNWQYMKFFGAWLRFVGSVIAFTAGYTALLMVTVG